MSVKQCWLWGIIGGIIIAAIIMFAADALSHGEGECLTDAVGNVPLSNGGWVKVVDHLEGSDLDGYKHGHLNQYFGKNGKTTKKTTEFYDIEFGDFFASCPTAPPSPSTPITSTPTTSTTPEPVRVSTPTRARGSTLLGPSDVSEEVIEQIVQVQYTAPNPTCDADFSIENIICYNWEITERYQLMGFPVLPFIWGETIRDLHTLFERRLRIKSFLSQAFVDGRWVSYHGFGKDEINPEIGDMLITPHLGLMVNLKESVGFVGYPQLGEVIDLEPGIHLIGLPEVPLSYPRASDLVGDDGVEWVRLGYERPTFIDSVDDADDQDLRAGQAIRVSVTAPVTLDLRGTIVETLAAPSVRRKDTLATSWGAMKR